MQAIKVLKEAEAYDGPSIIICYAPCISHGIVKGLNSIHEEKEATEAGYFPLFHYSPVTTEFSLDSKADFSKYQEFIKGENRYLTLSKLVDNAEEILNQSMENAKERYECYEEMVKKEESETK